MARSFGVNTWVWVSPTTSENFPHYVRKVKALGFDLIEVGIEDTDALDYHAAGRLLHELDMGISLTAAMSPDRDLLVDDEDVRRNAVAYLRHCIDACAELGSSTLAGPMYSAVGRVWEQTPESRERDSERLAAQLRPLAAYAFEHGVTLCLEPLNRFETSFLNTSEQMNEVIDRIDHPACKVLLDTFHMNIEEKSLGDAIRSCGPRLGHFHACGNDRGAPGSGHVPWLEVRQALHDVGYDGPIVIESFTSEVKSIARAAAIWRSFEVSQDALAENGLAFLRELFGE